MADDDTPTRRTTIRPPKHSLTPAIPAGTVIEAGPRVERGPGAVTRTPLARRDVYVNGIKVGHVEQLERRATVPTHRGSRIGRITGHPVEWAGSNRTRRATHQQLNEAVYAVVNRHFETQARTPDSAR